MLIPSFSKMYRKFTPQVAQDNISQELVARQLEDFSQALLHSKAAELTPGEQDLHDDNRMK